MTHTMRNVSMTILKSTTRVIPVLPITTSSKRLVASMTRKTLRLLGNVVFVEAESWATTFQIITYTAQEVRYLPLPPGL